MIVMFVCTKMCAGMNGMPDYRCAEDAMPTICELKEIDRVRGDAEALLRMYKNRTNAR